MAQVVRNLVAVPEVGIGRPFQIRLTLVRLSGAEVAGAAADAKEQLKEAILPVVEVLGL
jgi:hypothetical protein